jgi:hypothetical protein
LPDALTYSNILYVDEKDAGFSRTGNWVRTQATQPNNAYKMEFLQGAPGTTLNEAVWTFSLPPGDYLFAHIWPSFPPPTNKVFSPEAAFSITDGAATIWSGPINQQLAPVGVPDGSYIWQGLGVRKIANGQVTVRLRNGNNGKYVLADAVRVERAGFPVIVTQPIDQFVEVGGRVLFIAGGTGTQPLNYQWFKNGEKIEGATQAIYLTPAVVAADNKAKFMCRVANQFGAVPTRDAVLTIASQAIVQPAQDATNVTLGPNPCVVSEGCSAIQITTPGKSCRLRISNQLGQLLHETTIQENGRWDISGIASGAYTYFLECGHDGTDRGRIVIIR